MSRSLLVRTADLLAKADIPHALIGVGAMASHGVSRSTLDLDLLAMGTGYFPAAKIFRTASIVSASPAGLSSR